MHSLYLISGATGGLGKAFAAECASRGWDLLLTDLSRPRLAALAQGLERGYSINARYHVADLTDSDSRLSLVQRAAEESIRLQGLINVAGLDHEGMFVERSGKEITEILRLNIESVLLMTHLLIPYRDPTRTFRIINVSSLGAYFSMPSKATYAASKRFLLDFSLALREELRDQNASVTALCPAGLPTTAECVDAIEAQGIMGMLTTVNVGAAAHQAVEAALQGRPIVVPGWLNRFLLGTSRLVPPQTLAGLIGGRWNSVEPRRSGRPAGGPPSQSDRPSRNACSAATAMAGPESPRRPVLVEMISSLRARVMATYSSRRRSRA